LISTIFKNKQIKKHKQSTNHNEVLDPFKIQNKSSDKIKNKFPIKYFIIEIIFLKSTQGINKNYWLINKNF
jgi:hypothetical protein